MKVGFIGCGNMGGALALAVSKCGVSELEILIYDKDTSKAAAFAEKVGGVSVPVLDLVRESDCVFLGVKPNILPFVIDEVKDVVKNKKSGFLISMAAGVKLEKIDAMLDCRFPVIRIMPNTSVAYGKGVVLYCGNSAVSDGDVKVFKEILKCGGYIEPIAEDKIDAASAISGCGPAFAYMFIEALADGGVACGLSRADAMRFAEGMLEGAAVSARLDGRHPEELKDAVCSPAGSTIEGVLSLEKDAFRSAVSEAVIKSYKKTLDLGK